MGFGSHPAWFMKLPACKDLYSAPCAASEQQSPCRADTPFCHLLLLSYACGQMGNSVGVVRARKLVEDVEAGHVGVDEVRQRNVRAWTDAVAALRMC